MSSYLASPSPPVVLPPGMVGASATGVTVKVEAIDLNSPSSNLRLAVIMVGLPARGKSFMARKIARYIKWLGYSTNVFATQTYQRQQLSASTVEMYDPNNAQGAQRLEAIFNQSLEELIDWFSEGGQIGFFDAGNETKAQRAHVAASLRAKKIRMLFIEVYCDDEGLIASNIEDAIRSDRAYSGMDVETARDTYRRIIEYRSGSYETVDEDDLPYVKSINMGKQVVINAVKGYIEGRIVFLITQLHHGVRDIVLAPHGQNVNSATHTFGGNASLTVLGLEYAANLERWIAANMAGPGKEIEIWGGDMLCSEEALNVLRTSYKVKTIRALNDINYGSVEGLTFKEFRERFPSDYKSRKANRFKYSFPGGESYSDLVARLEPVIMDLEAVPHDVVVVCHKDVLRVLHAYFLEASHEAAMRHNLQLHAVEVIAPHSYTVKEVFIGPVIEEDPTTGDYIMDGQ